MALRKRPEQKSRQAKPASQWHSKKDITSLTLAGRKEPGLPKKRTWGKPSKEVFGHGIYGDIYLGRIRFKGGKPQRVAIKRFSKALTAKEVKAYEKAIQDLTAAGIHLPKTGFYEFDNKGVKEWVQVTQLFAKQGKSKLINPEVTHIKDPALAKKYVKLGAKIINAGYPFWPDMLAVMGKEVIAFDLDALVNDALKKNLRQSPVDYFNRAMLETRGVFVADRATTNEIFESFIKALKSRTQQEHARIALERIKRLK